MIEDVVLRPESQKKLEEVRAMPLKQLKKLIEERSDIVREPVIESMLRPGYTTDGAQILRVVGWSYGKVRCARIGDPSKSKHFRLYTASGMTMNVQADCIKGIVKAWRMMVMADFLLSPVLDDAGNLSPYKSFDVERLELRTALKALLEDGAR